MANQLARSRRFVSLGDNIPLPPKKFEKVQDMLGFSPVKNQNEFSNSIKDMRVLRSSNSAVVFRSNTLIDTSSNLIFIPTQLCLIPASEWTLQPMTLKQIQESYFLKRNGTSRQFDIKLYNALCITKFEKSAFLYVGVEWIDSKNFKVNEKIFSKFIGLSVLDVEETFAKYGFTQIYKGDNPILVRNLHCEDVDDNSVRVYQDPLKRFERDRPFDRVEY